MYIDRSSAQEGARTGILFVGPDNEEFKYSIKFTFSITNNMMKYEDLLTGLRLARRIRVDRLKVVANSQLVIRQVTREYEVTDPVIKTYNGIVKQLWAKFS